MWRLYGGVILILGGIAAFIEAHRHIPVPARHPEVGLISPASGLSPTAYDLLRLGGWALVILGAVTVALGLIRYAVGYAGTKPLATTGISANGASKQARPPATAKTAGQSGAQETQPWDEGAHGEAVEPPWR
jgi:hypothetical protein